MFEGGVRVTVAGAVAAAMLSGACGEATGPDDDSGPVTIQVVTAPPIAYSGEPAALTLRVLGRGGVPLGGTPVLLQPQQGTVAQESLVTGPDGVAGVTWHLADADGRQTLRVRAGTASLDFALTTIPRLTGLVLQGVPPTVALGDVTPVPEVRGTTSTGRVVVVSGFSLIVEGQQSLYADLPVGEIVGQRVRATGPGTMTIRAVVGELESGPVSVEVPAGRPILLRVSPAVLPAADGELVIEGYDLEGVVPETVRMAGVVITGAQVSQQTIRLQIRGEAAGCYGRDVVAIEVPAAYLPAGVLAVRRSPENTVQLEPGAVRSLGRASEMCLRLGGGPGAEYVLAYFDPRGIESARTGPEDTQLEYQSIDLSVVDRSTAPAAPSPGPVRAVQRWLTAGGGPLPVPDIVRWSGAANLSATDYEKLWNQRSTPWAVGDTFAIWGDDAKLSPGVIFLTRGRFAVGSMLRDSLYRIPARLQGMVAALDNFANRHAGFLGRVFGVDWPVTTSGSNQTLLLVGDFFAPGFMAPGEGVVDRGNFVGIDPAVAESPLDQPLWFDLYVLLHEMSHAYQDRYLMKRCAEIGDCGADLWAYRWAVEGGADFLTQQQMRVQLGLSLNGNYPLDGPVSGSLGGLVYWGELLEPHYGFSDGYGSSGWFLTDLMYRAIAAGVPYEAAVGEVAMGAFEGWFGYGTNGVMRPGLATRSRAWFGPAWEPVPAAIEALLAIAADDRTGSASLRVPYVLEAWRRIAPGGEFVLGQSRSVVMQGRGLTFAYYKIIDADGLGGTIQLSARDAGLEWSILRIR